MARIRIGRAARTLTRNLHVRASSAVFGEIRSRTAGADPNSSSASICIYVHYDMAGLLHRYVREQVAALRAHGYRIVFVSQADSTPDLELLAPDCIALFHRRNIGHDFGAYRFGLRWLRTQRGASDE